MKKTYQTPETEITAMESNEMIAASIQNVIGKDSSSETSFFKYGGGGTGPARAGENHLWEEEEGISGWDNL